MSTIKCVVVNLAMNKITTADLSFRPCVGDNFPVNYMKEVVTKVAINTPMLKDSMNLPDDINLVIFTE